MRSRRGRRGGVGGMAAVAPGLATSRTSAISRREFPRRYVFVCPSAGPRMRACKRPSEPGLACFRGAACVCRPPPAGLAIPASRHLLHSYRPLPLTHGGQTEGRADTRHGSRNGSPPAGELWADGGWPRASSQRRDCDLHRPALRHGAAEGSAVRQEKRIRTSGKLCTHSHRDIASARHPMLEPRRRAMFRRHDRARPTLRPLACLSPPTPGGHSPTGACQTRRVWSPQCLLTLGGGGGGGWLRCRRGAGGA